MSSSSYETSKTLEEENKIPNKKILLTCEVVNDGVGDFYHLLDLARNENKFMVNYKKDIFITTSHEKKQLENFKKNLENLGFKTTIADSPSSIQEALNTGKSIDKKAFILDLEINRKVTQEILEKSYAGIVDVSVPVYLFLNLPRISITEYGRTDTTACAKTIVPMDLLFGTQSIFLSEENRKNPANQLAEVLSKEENSNVLAALLETNSQDPVEIQKKCEELLTNNLFVPAYLQHKPAAIVNFINITTDSPLSQKYKATIFFVNKVDDVYLEGAAANGLLSKAVKTIIIKTKDGEKKIDNPNANPDAKIIKLVSGYRIPDDNDYKKLFHCAQYFAGCSGDKSLELALSNGLIPLFIAHNRHKISFIKNASEVDILFKFMGHLNDVHYLCDKALTNYTTPLIKELEFLKDIKYTNEDLALNKLETQKRVREIANFLDQNFFEKWTKLCINLKENYNLHDKLPNIINTFFQEKGLDVTSSKNEEKNALVFSDQKMSSSNVNTSQVSSDTPKPKIKNEK